MKTFIDKDKIDALLKSANPKEASRVIKKALRLKGLTSAETAVLLNTTDKKILKSLFQAAKKVKEEIYGNRLVLFAPLYITNYCVNNCLYCGFRTGNKKLTRRRLSIEEIKEQVAILEQEGHKRILLVGGEDPVAGSVDYLETAIRAVYEVKVGRGEIRRLNVNIAPLGVSDFKRLSKSSIGTYQLFQETYQPDVYKVMHSKGPKSDYAFRLYSMHRAMRGGIKDVGIGVLFGLADYRFEVLALLLHALELEKDFGVGPHTISVPRIEPAFGTPLTGNPPHPVSDEEFKQLVAILRLAVPYTGIILSTREKAKLRNEVFALGVSQISAGSRTTPGGYQSRNQSHSTTEQFSLHDSRSLLEVIKDISKMGYAPSFCTACYRLGRTGKDFMDLAKPGLIKKFCQPNSLLTFKEYLEDYGDAEAKRLGEKVIKKAELNSAFQKKLKMIEEGSRDLYC